MSNSIQTAGSGISFGTLLFLVFLVLKLTNVIAWSWWWVTAPLWIPVALGIGILLIGVLITILALLLNDKK